jgi:L-arabinonolactonase
MNAACVVDCRNTLGEGCVWDPRNQTLYWTDIEEQQIYSLQSDGTVRTVLLPERAAFILPRASPGFVIGFASRIAVCDASFQEFVTVATVEPDVPQTRVNDATVAPDGGVVFGTFDEKARLPVAGLYRLSPTGKLTHLLGGVAIANGLAFSPDGKLLYFADTADGAIRRFRVSRDFRSFEETTPLAGPDVGPGRPDGAAIDSEGCYWSARVWGGCVVRISPEGELLQSVSVPVKGPTCVAFGGSDMTRLFLTSFRMGYSPDELAGMPLAGGVFAADVAVPGEPQPLCAL